MKLVLLSCALAAVGVLGAPPPSTEIEELSHGPKDGAEYSKPSVYSDRRAEKLVGLAKLSSGRVSLEINQPNPQQATAQPGSPGTYSAEEQPTRTPRKSARGWSTTPGSWAPGTRDQYTWAPRTRDPYTWAPRTRDPYTWAPRTRDPYTWAPRRSTPRPWDSDPSGSDSWDSGTSGSDSWDWNLDDWRAPTSADDFYIILVIVAFILIVLGIFKLIGCWVDL